MNDFEFPSSPNELHKHTGLHRRQEDLRLQLFRHAFNEGVLIDWPNRPRYRVTPTIHAGTAAAYLVCGQREGDAERGGPGVFVRSAADHRPGPRADEVRTRR